MNRYILIRRLRGPAILLLIGIIALLHQADMAGWGLFIPLLLILIGVLKLAERAALAAADDIPSYPGGYPGASYPYAAAGSSGGPQPAQPGSSIVSPPQDPGNKGPEGGLS
ncbi:MAG TPA: hypothetical protein VFI20_04290 [Terracidiphilus sp.]|nr:hypothetical protein [Terracidiphilus sp.]